MIIEIVFDIRYFLFILLLAVLGFANGFYILAKNIDEENPFAGKTFLKSIGFAYRMGLGDFDTSEFEGDYES
jgi:hypothetical protein